MHNSSPIHIAFSVAGKYADYVGTAIYSILKHNAESSIKIYILHQEIEAEYKRNLEQLMTHFQNTTIQFVKIENQYLEKIKPAKDGLHISTYYRFLLAELLPDVNKILYLDVDVLIRGEIRTLWNTDLSTASLGVSREIDIYAGCPEHVYSIGLEDHHNYFNAGVLLFNLQKLRSEQLDKLLLETAVSKSPELRFGDQDILNMIFKDDCVLFSYVYNFTNWRLMWPEINEQDGIILHFSGSGKTKPWNNKHQTFDYLSPYIDEYRRYRMEYYDLISSHQPKVAVVLEIHDQDQHIKECIDSIIRQSYFNIEVILTLDAPTPACLQIARDYEKNDGHIRLLTPSNETRTKRYQSIVHETTATYILFIREVDLIEEDYIKRLVEKAELEKADITLANYFIYNSNDGVFYFHHPLQPDGIIKHETLQSLDHKQEMYLEHLWGKLFTIDHLSKTILTYTGNLLLSDVYSTPSIYYLSSAEYMYREQAPELVSAIVTAYNVAPYIEECIQSILKQTYQHLEVIIVNDGSTDSTAEICDELARQDNRIKVIHKENGGASEAKNLGVMHASGEYLTLIDGDDLIENDLIATLYRHCKEEQADIAMGHYFRYDESDGKFHVFDIDHHTNFEVVSPQEAVLRQTHWGKYNNSNYIVTVCKLIKKSCFQNVEFPVGRKFDDEATTHKLFLKTNKIVQVNKNLYIYRKRKNSIMTSGFNLSWIDDFIPIYESKIADCLLAQLPLKDIRQRYLNILSEYKHLMEIYQLTDSIQYHTVLQKIEFAEK